MPNYPVQTATGQELDDEDLCAFEAELCDETLMDDGEYLQ
jgi:hypothetical protein